MLQVIDTVLALAQLLCRVKECRLTCDRNILNCADMQRTQLRQQSLHAAQTAFGAVNKARTTCSEF